jgi:excisionase family DNA binding protein
MSEELLTVREVAERLKISEYTVRKLCRAQKIRAKKLPGGSEWRISSAEIDKLT